MQFLHNLPQNKNPAEAGVNRNEDSCVKRLPPHPALRGHLPPRGKALGESLLRQQMCLLQGGAQGDVQDNGADGGEQGVDQRHTAGNLGHDGDELRGLAKDVQVAEVADERVGEHVDQQAAEGRRRDGGHVLELVVSGEGPEVDDLVGHRTADQADNKFQDKALVCLRFLCLFILSIYNMRLPV